MKGEAVVSFGRVTGEGRKNHLAVRWCIRLLLLNE